MIEDPQNPEIVTLMHEMLRSSKEDRDNFRDLA